MNTDERTQLQKVGQNFQIDGEFKEAHRIKIGHINETFAVTYIVDAKEVRYIHQTLNTSVFKEPIPLMGNVLQVTEHLRSRLSQEGATDLDRRALRVIRARDGHPFYIDSDDRFWRTFLFVERVKTFEAAETPAQAYQAGLAFGHFQSLLSDLPAQDLAVTIPDFHNTRKRFERLKAAIERDEVQRCKIAAREVRFALDQEPMVDVLLTAHARGEIPERVTHNDTKFNNVMLDVVTGKAMCVVDLDTVMPGCALYDFGDMIRTTTSPTLEDERDLTKVKMHLPIFKKLAEGYLSTAGDCLNKAEKNLMAFSGKLITLELGFRFLTDFLSGDNYFRIHRPDHNLDRCRTQFKLVESIEQQEKAMQKFVDGL